MTAGWNGPDPAGVVDPDDYELGTEYLANSDVTLTHVRVWSSGTEAGFTGRKGRVWSTGGIQLGIATLPNTLPAGWSSYALDVPVERLAGQRWVVSYSTGGNYAFGNHYLDSAVTSSDGAVTAVAAANATPARNGVFNVTPATFPTSGNAGNAFYGADVEYSLGVGGNTPPRILSLTATPAGAVVTATVTAEDSETLAGASYRFEWGDGSSPTVATVPTATHAYTASGAYAVLCTVMDAGGAIDYAATAVIVTVPPPGAPAPAPSEFVGLAWAEWALAGTAQTGTSLPRTNDWITNGAFVTATEVGGEYEMYTPIAGPVIAFDCWAGAKDSQYPPIGVARAAADRLRQSAQRMGFTLERPALALPPKYQPVLLGSVWPVGNVMRVPEPETGFAHFAVHIAMLWSERDG